MKSYLIRNTVFGVEDGLVSTVGFLSGIAAAGIEKNTVLLTGVILIFVEAFSMGVGSVLSDHEGREFEEHKEIPMERSAMGGVIIFISYLLAGIIPLAPYVFLSGAIAIWISIILTLIALFILGIIAGKWARIPPIKQGLQMLILGGIAIILGIVVGQFLK